MECEEKAHNDYNDYIGVRKRVKPNSTKQGWQIGLLRLLRINRNYEDPLNLGGTIDQDYSPLEHEKALLNAEITKAKALMEWQKHSVIY